MKKTPEEMLAELLKHKNKVPDLEDLSSAILEEFGGVKAFAQEFKRLYTSCGNTKMAQVKLMDSATRLQLLAHENRKPSPLDTMTMQEMQSTLAEVMRTYNATTEETKPPAGPT